MGTTLFLHRRNLRVADNRGLTAAADGDAGDVVSVFGFDDDVLSHAIEAAFDSYWTRLRNPGHLPRRGSDLLLARGRGEPE